MRRTFYLLLVLSAATSVLAQSVDSTSKPPNWPPPPPPGGSGELGYTLPPANGQMPQGPSPYAYQVVSSTTPAPQTVLPTTERFLESDWYAKIDYFHWNERLDGEDFVNEYGTLVTVGYEHRFDIERVRAEIFGATMKYVGFAQSPGLPDVPLRSTTNYLGFRAEYDLLFQPESLPSIDFFAGLGTRFWVRDMKDDFDDNGDPVMGYQETWWTFYPYIGVEKRRTHDDSIEFYYSARIGCTPLTYQRVEDFATTLYPQCGLTGQLEAGIRGRRFFCSVLYEGISWAHSDVVRESLQPASQLTTFGIKAGYSF